MESEAEAEAPRWAPEEWQCKEEAAVATGNTLRRRVDTRHRAAVTAVRRAPARKWPRIRVRDTLEPPVEEGRLEP